MMKPFTSVTAHAPHSSVYPSCNDLLLHLIGKFPFHFLPSQDENGVREGRNLVSCSRAPNFRGKNITGHYAVIIPKLSPPPKKKTTQISLLD